MTLHKAKRMRLQLIDNWKSAWKFWSVKIIAIGGGIPSLLALFSDHAIAIWNVLPIDLKEAIPERYMLWYAIAIIAASIVARIIKQDELHEKLD